MVASQLNHQIITEAPSNPLLNLPFTMDDIITRNALCVGACLSGDRDSLGVMAI